MIVQSKHKNSRWQTWRTSVTDQGLLNFCTIQELIYQVTNVSFFPDWNFCHGRCTNLINSFTTFSTISAFTSCELRVKDIKAHFISQLHHRMRHRVSFHISVCVCVEFFLMLSRYLTDQLSDLQALGFEGPQNVSRDIPRVISRMWLIKNCSPSPLIISLILVATST